MGFVLGLNSEKLVSTDKQNSSLKRKAGFKQFAGLFRKHIEIGIQG